MTINARRVRSGQTRPTSWTLFVTHLQRRRRRLFQPQRGFFVRGAEARGPVGEAGQSCPEQRRRGLGPQGLHQRRRRRHDRARRRHWRGSSCRRCCCVITATAAATATATTTGAVVWRGCGLGRDQALVCVLGLHRCCGTVLRQFGAVFRATCGLASQPGAFERVQKGLIARFTPMRPPYRAPNGKNDQGPRRSLPKPGLVVLIFPISIATFLAAVRRFGPSTFRVATYLTGALIAR